MPTAVVIGTRFGAEAHVPALRAAGYEVAGLVGRDLAKTQAIAERNGVPRAFASLEDALAIKPFVVAHAGPPHTHAPLTRLALEAGAHVVCEKPFTRTIEEAIELRDLAAAKGLVGLLCHEFRYVPQIALMARLIADGAIGAPRLATFVAHGGLVADVNLPRPDWWFNEELGGGWLGASGSHGIDRIADWYGPIAGLSVQRLCAAERAEGVADDTFDMHFRTVSGVVGTYQSTAAAWGPPLSLSRAVGTGGTVWMEDQIGRGILESSAGPVFFADQSGTREIEVPADLRIPHVPDDGPWSFSISPLAAMYRELSAMAAGKATSQACPRPATFATGVANMRILAAARRSAAQGGAWVEVDKG